MDTFLIVSIFLVFVTALVGSYLQHRKRDRVLAELHGFQITALMDNGQKVWGEMEVFPNGLEMKYPRPYQNQHGHYVTSYIMFQEGMSNIARLFRVHGELNKKNQHRREKEIEKTRNPGALRILFRKIQNFMNTFRDAINESMGMLLTRMKGTSSLSVFKTQDQHLKKIGNNAVVAAGNAFDPILERHLGKPVVVELQLESRKIEYAGLLREYSQSWISLFDCKVSLQNWFSLGDDMRMSLQRDMDFIFEATSGADNKQVLTITVHCFSKHGLHCKRIEGKDYQFDLNKRLVKGDVASWVLTDIPEDLWKTIAQDKLPLSVSLIAAERLTNEESNNKRDFAQPDWLPDLHLLIENECKSDVFVPRTLAVLRHSGVKEALT